MVSVHNTLARLVAFVSLASLFVVDSSALPTSDLSKRVKYASAATQDAPHFAVYSDQWVSGENGPPDVSVVNGFNTFLLSFLLSSGAADQALEWQSITADQRAAIKQQYADAGVKLLVSAFGSTEQPTTSGLDPVATANTMAAWVKDYGLDGIDVDYEDFTAFNDGTDSPVTWLNSFTTQLRDQLPSSDYLITHAPVAPWFESTWAGGGYLAVHNAVGDLIDWYNVQFYNQGTTEYTDCEGLLNTSGSPYPGSSVFEIAANGVPLDKIVIGKPATASDANNGYIDPTTLAGCVSQAKSNGWNAGVMAWQYPNAASSWIETVRSQAWPL